MYLGRFVFSQVIAHLPMSAFRTCVKRYQGNRKIKSFTCLDQYLCMAFAQMTFRESLRDIEACLRAQQGKLYHMGIRGTVSRNTLANANKVRDWRIYADFAQTLIQHCPPIIHRRRFRHRTGKHGLCFGFHHHRSLPERFPMGVFSKNQSRHQTAYTTWIYAAISRPLSR